jgi:hypothetical protein
MTDIHDGAARMITLDLRLAGTVERYHTWPTIRRQSVAEHTWQILRIYTTIFGPPDEDTFLYIMFHDCGELTTGDPPYPVKAHNPALRQEFQKLEDKAKDSAGTFWSVDIPLHSDKPKHVKVAELIEMAEEGLVETTMGNRYGWTVAVRTLDPAFNMLCEFSVSEAKAIRNYVLRRLNVFIDQQCDDETAKSLLGVWREPNGGQP